jgi:hypothetical protein
MAGASAGCHAHTAKGRCVGAARAPLATDAARWLPCAWSPSQPLSLSPSHTPIPLSLSHMHPRQTHGNLSAAPPCRDLSVSLPRGSDSAVAPTSSRDLSGSLLLSSGFSVALPVCACACACGCACGMCGAAGGGGVGPAGGADPARRSARRALHGLLRPRCGAAALPVAPQGLCLCLGLGPLSVPR